MKNKKVKAMIESISKPIDLYGVTILDLPWVSHPLAYMHFDRSYGRDVKVQLKVKNIVSEAKWDYISEVIHETDQAWDFAITFTKEGSEVDEHFVEERFSGCIAGDSFAGDAWIPITNKRYLKFSFSG